MRIPEGKVLGSAREVSVREAVQQAMEKKLTGYLVIRGEGIIVLDEGRILDAISQNAKGDEVLRKFLTLTADVEVHVLDDIEIVVLTRMLGIETDAHLNHLLAEQQPAHDREELLRRYGIREPTDMEVESIIRKALEE